MKYLTASLPLCLSLLLDLAVQSNAIKIHGVRTPRDESFSLDRRAAMSSSGDLRNDQDLKYFTNISLNDQPFPVLIDTGSSDLYIAGSIAGAGNTGKSAKVSYAIGGASGPVLTAKMDFEGFTIMDQAFILDTSGNNPKGEGLIGLGPNSESNVHQVLNNKNGDTPLDRIFRDNTSTPNFITIYLGRSDDPTDPFPGDLTIGSVVPGYGNITSQPKLPVLDVRAKGGQHWQTLLDANGIIGPDGKPINTTSHVSGGGKNQLNVIMDSGFSLPQVPKSIADAIYARVPGAEFKNVTGFGQTYTLPCDVELNITFKFHNVSYPVHPLDTTLDIGRKDSSGNSVCIGAFQPIMPGAESPTFDAIFGMGFLRNAYMLINFGDFVDGASSKTADPFLQLLPLTDDLTEAHSDFVNIRLMGNDNTGNFQLLPSSVLPPNNDSTTSDNNNNDSVGSKIKKYLPYIIAGSAVIGLLLIAAVIGCCMSSRKKRYRRLHDPAPHGLERVEPFERYRPARRY
ncbi:acid protease [Irpex rosettiformis]|uniref:Acid protease n=1 Tax=Irpex rosettiformis TaxID=378272 RepID=A0ACB8UG57_9APHY|nr:acid protease [Irpex rosettiformis]